MLFDKLDPLAFALSLGFGLMIVYVVAPRPRRVIRFPMPNNSGKIVYKDALQGCYVYKTENATCDKDAIDIPSESP